jgi:glycosyltransferase involved in cell wall biosynthesis
MKDLAVIMSVYINDRLEFVKESVGSILRQTYSEFDYFISFDGPVEQEVDRFLSSLKDERIRLFRMQENGGLAKALNFLLEKILIDPGYIFIARMDADDVSMPARFEKQRSFLIKNSDISVVGSWYEDIDEKGKTISYHRLPTDHEQLRKRYFVRAPFAHSSVMYRKSLIEVAGFYPTDTILMEDNVLWGRALIGGMRFANIPEYLLRFRRDKLYYKRRSGIHYGWNYIKTKFRINRLMNFPFYSYIFSFIIGIYKMMPSFALRLYYLLVNN